MGLFKLGSIIKYIPEPVIVGFTSGVALTIWIGQWKDFFGLSVHFQSASIGSKLLDLFHAFQSFDSTTTSISIISLFIIFLTNKYLKPLPGFLVALIAATGAQYFFDFSSVATIGTTFGGIPQTLPTFKLPTFSFHLLLN